MCLCIYIATNLQRVYVNWLLVGAECNSRSAWISQCCEHRDTLRGRVQVSLAIHSAIVCELVCRSTCRPWSGKLGGHIWASLEIHLEAVIEQIWKLELGAHNHANLEAAIKQFGGHNRASLETHLEAMMVRAWRLWWCEHGGYEGANMDAVIVEVLTSTWPHWMDWGIGCWACIHQLVNLQLWDCDKVMLPFNSHGELVWWRSII
jgi:hypothetical protein